VRCNFLGTTIGGSADGQSVPLQYLSTAQKPAVPSGFFQIHLVYAPDLKALNQTKPFFVYVSFFGIKAAFGTPSKPKQKVYK